MAGASSPLPQSRPLRIAVLTATALLLTSFFVYLGFPYDRLADVAARHVQSATGYQLSYGAVEASPGLLGPGLAIESLTATAPGGDRWDFSRLRVRPAWSPAWFTGKPALYVDAETEFGRVRGVAVVAELPAFDGEALGVDLKALLNGSLPPRTEISGNADIEADVAMGPEGPSGPVSLVVREGVLSHPSLPMDVPYQEIEGELLLGGENTAEILSLTIDSPLGSGRISGTVGQAPVMSRAALDLSVEISAAEDIRGALSAQGVRFGADGNMTLQVTGTVARPQTAVR